jgi:hypothetical protein
MMKNTEEMEVPGGERRAACGAGSFPPAKNRKKRVPAMSPPLSQSVAVSSTETPRFPARQFSITDKTR